MSFTTSNRNAKLHLLNDTIYSTNIHDMLALPIINNVETRHVWIVIHVLCVSSPSANEFSAIIILLLARSSSNSPWSFQSLDKLRFDHRWRFFLGKLFTRCRIWMGTKGCPKRWNGRGEFEIDWAKSENNIAENSFALALKTLSRL